MAKKTKVEYGKVTVTIDGKRVETIFSNDSYQLGQKQVDIGMEYYKSEHSKAGTNKHIFGKAAIGRINIAVTQNCTNTKLVGKIQEKLFPELSNIERANYKRLAKLLDDKDSLFGHWREFNFPKVHAETRLFNSFRKHNKRLKDYFETENKPFDNWLKQESKTKKADINTLSFKTVEAIVSEYETWLKDQIDGSEEDTYDDKPKNTVEDSPEKVLEKLTEITGKAITVSHKTGEAGFSPEQLEDLKRVLENTLQQIFDNNVELKVAVNQ